MVSSSCTPRTCCLRPRTTQKQQLVDFAFTELTGFGAFFLADFQEQAISCCFCVVLGRKQHVLGVQLELTIVPPVAVWSDAYTAEHVFVAQHRISLLMRRFFLNCGEEIGFEGLHTIKVSLNGSLRFVL